MNSYRLYNPSWCHYGFTYSVNIQCDRCKQQHLLSCYGEEGKNVDICCRCFEELQNLSVEVKEFIEDFQKMTKPSITLELGDCKQSKPCKHTLIFRDNSGYIIKEKKYVDAREIVRILTDNYDLYTLSKESLDHLREYFETPLQRAYLDVTIGINGL